MLNLDDYGNAPSGEGPLAAQWNDKPHRLLYDLIREIEELRAKVLPPEVIPLSEHANRENLLKLANFLLEFSENPLPNVTFNMNKFSSFSGYGEETVCGTIGCAAGFGPYAGIPKNSNEDWYDYTTRVFLSSDSGWNAWDWCFNADWARKDNTPQGAAKRILWMLNNNGIPSNAFAQMHGHEPLCY